MSFLDTLEPHALWRHFDHILTIPRPSKDEGRMRDYVLEVADQAGLEHQVDGTGNAVVRKPASAGREGAAPTILQAHLDMVQEKNSNVDHDFASDAIQPQRDGDYVKASGTTLGSDNGIGVAAMLAIMESDAIEHGPLELLFTVDEETGLTGAAGLDASMLTGKRLINLDSEEEGTLTVGCAGGADSTVTLGATAAETPGGQAASRVRLHGLKGGHSGIDIHLQRGNAIQLLARALWAVRDAHPFRLAELAGGNAHNAIPREAHATVVTAAGGMAALLEALTAEIDAIRSEYRTPDPGIELETGGVEVPPTAWDEATTASTLELLFSLPHGVVSMSNDIPGLVETSTNLATVAPKDGALEIMMSSRSSVASALVALRQRIRAVGALAGAAVQEHDGYPGWEPDMGSPLLATVRAIHERELGSDPEVVAVHAGLECGLIGEMIPGMDMISFGPQIEFPHSPDERVQVASVERFFRLLTATLGELSSAA